MLTRNHRKLVHAYRLCNGGEEDSLQLDYNIHIEGLKSYKGDAELYSLVEQVESDHQEEDSDIGEREFERMYSLVVKELELKGDVVLTDEKLMLAFIDYIDRNPQFGYDADTIRKAYVLLKTNDFKVPGMKDLGAETPANTSFTVD